MIEKIRHAIDILLGRDDDSEAEGYPFTLTMPDGFQHVAEKYVLLTDSEWRVVGIKWGTAKWGVREFHGNGFTILFNPRFQLSETPEVEKLEDVYHA